MRATLDGGVGFRRVATDRLPMVGAIVDIDRARADQAALAGAHLADPPRVRAPVRRVRLLPRAACRGRRWRRRRWRASSMPSPRRFRTHCSMRSIRAASSSRRCGAARFSASLEAIQYKLSTETRHARLDSHLLAEYARHRRPPEVRRRAAGLSHRRWSGRSSFSITWPGQLRRRDEASTCARIRTSASPPSPTCSRASPVHRDSLGIGAGDRAGRRQLDDRRARHRALRAHRARGPAAGGSAHARHPDLGRAAEIARARSPSLRFSHHPKASLPEIEQPGVTNCACSPARHSAGVRRHRRFPR